jgi:hypothetical protein
LGDGLLTFFFGVGVGEESCLTFFGVVVLEEGAGELSALRLPFDLGVDAWVAGF